MRVRFAPSPTGNLHIGTLRTALFNWLLAKANNGTFILRIEDTDQARSDASYETSILEGLAWLGLTQDEGPTQPGKTPPYRQSERMTEGLYQSYADKLVQAGKAYPCFCTTEDLDAERQAAQDKSIPYVYSRKCANLSADEKAALQAKGTPSVLRYSMPEEGTLSYTDLIRGEISFDLSLISDFVIMKSDGSPSYNFAVVVDDLSMEITHVVRGEDHISNMPKQLCIFKDLSDTLPEFAHMPMILGPDKSKLSKRHGATNVIEYKEQGYLPEAMFNFLSLLGWSPNSEQELFSVYEIIKQFSLDRVSKAGAVFDTTKLTWMNGQYLRALPSKDLLEKLKPVMTEDVKALFESYSESAQHKIVDAIRDNLTLTVDVNQAVSAFESDAKTAEKLADNTFNEDAHTVLKQFLSLVESGETLTAEEVDRYFQAIFDETGLGKGKVFKPVRVSCSGEGSGPHIPALLEILGRERVVNRLRLALK